MAKRGLILKNIFIYKKSLLNFNFIKAKKRELISNFSLQKYFKLFDINKKKLFVRFKKRCFISGRQRSYYNRFFLNRNLIRKIGNFGNIIGMEKSSW
ncbi:uS14 family ribosomal protein [Candidatus Carsonella ruddii]|uniref:30S ribosomal protein S14 n=1 Tax=Candidatus Carsonella ruddii (Diaphorina cf. continua) TaxID=2661587 RepID=A0A7R7ACH8_CARRU|nr:uS14 family ribosomal protein [Candidatus Carsonella ruddii (Diaphorina cf. continua)]BCG49384.1 30S ribosomal protein S14 [Candidatus Carsonella ruddii (Diaphorina cf. continua)]